LKICVAITATEMDALRPAWESLYAESETATMFQAFAWNRLAAECFGRRERPYVVFAEGAGGAAIIPAAIGSERLTLLGDALFDYRNVLSVGDEAPLRSAWAKLADLRLPLHVTALRGDTAHWDAFAPAPFVAAPQVAGISADEFAASHSRLGRTVRRLAGQGIRLHRRCGGATSLVRWIYRQKAAQFAGSEHNIFADLARVDFMAAACAMDEGCEIFTFETASAVVAALVTFQDRNNHGARDVRRFYTVYFDPAWAQHSPGIALCFEITRRTLADGFDCDYMTGEQPHKTRLMTSSVPLFRVNATAEMIAQAAHLDVPARLAA
jgi:hypothetical protein